MSTCKALQSERSPERHSFALAIFPFALARSTHLDALGTALGSHAQVVATFQRQNQFAPSCQAGEPLGHVAVHLRREVHAAKGVPLHRVVPRAHDDQVWRKGADYRLQYLGMGATAATLRLASQGGNRCR